MLTVYTLENAKQWDDIVRTFNEYDVYWLSGYVRAFKIHGDGEPLLFYYNDNETRGINLVMRRDVALDANFKDKIPSGKYFDFSTPYGYGGWIIEGGNTDKLFSSYEEYIKNNGIISEFVRFHPMIKNHLKCENFYEVTELGEVVHIDLESKDTIWNNLTSKNRNMIRKAIKNGVEIHSGNSLENYKEFREIYNETMQRDEADNYYFFGEEFYNSICDDLNKNAKIFWAQKDGKVIASSIMIFANDKMNYHLSGTLKEYGKFAPTNLLLYTAALWGLENGYKTFYLGGGVGSGEDSLFKFKKAFYKGELNHFYIGKKIYDKQNYEMLTDLRNDINNSEFFPEYRG